MWNRIVREVPIKLDVFRDKIELTGVYAKTGYSQVTSTQDRGVDLGEQFLDLVDLCLLLRSDIRAFQALDACILMPKTWIPLPT